MAETAALLVEHRLPVVPWRQWALSFPGPLSVRLGYDRALLGRVCQRFASGVMQTLRRLTRRTHGLASSAGLHPGVLIVVQRFRNDLGLFVHLHALVTDGCFDASDPAGFAPARHRLRHAAACCGHPGRSRPQSPRATVSVPSCGRRSQRMPSSVLPTVGSACTSRSPVPPSGAHTVRYYGVLAGHHDLRSWMTLLARVFRIGICRLSPLCWAHARHCSRHHPGANRRRASWRSAAPALPASCSTISSKAPATGECGLVLEPDLDSGEYSAWFIDCDLQPIRDVVVEDIQVEFGE